MGLVNFIGRAGGGCGGSCVPVALFVFMCACRLLEINGSLASALNGGERGGLTRFNCSGMHELRTSRSSNCRPSSFMVAWDRWRAVFGALNCASIPKLIGGIGDVYWGCCCSWMMLVSRGALWIIRLLLPVSSGLLAVRLMLPSAWPYVLR